MWKRHTKFKSKPCEKLKQIFKNSGLSFIEEYSNCGEHNYSIDIAFLEKHIAVEVNGQQHYNSDKTLKDYYQIRENYLKSIGWEVINVYYSLVYDEKYVSKLIAYISGATDQYNDFRFYIKKTNKFHNCSICGKRTYKSKYNFNDENYICKECKTEIDTINTNSIRKAIVEQSTDIIFGEIGWATLLSKKFQTSINKTKQWIKTYMPDFYNTECYPNRSLRKEIILTTSIDFSKRDWDKDLSKLFSISKQATYNWLKLNMPEFYKEKCWKKEEQHSNLVEERKQIVQNSNIDFSKRGWTSKLSNLFGLQRRQTLAWVKKNLPDFYNKKCYKYSKE